MSCIKKKMYNFTKNYGCRVFVAVAALSGGHPLQGNSKDYFFRWWPAQRHGHCNEYQRTTNKLLSWH